MAMSAPDFTMLVVAAFASIAAGLAYAVVARDNPGLRAAKLFAWLSALGFGSLGVIWGSANLTYPLGFRMAAAAIVAGIAAAALTWAIADINGLAKKQPDAVGGDPVKITFKNEAPFVTVDPAGANRRRMIRVRIANNTDKAISNGRLDVLNLDPPYRNDANWLLKDSISIAPHDQTFVEVVYYDEGSSQARPGTGMRLAVPMAGGFFGEVYPDLPFTPHTFFLKFSTLGSGFFDQMYCRIYVDDNHTLHFESGSELPKHSSAGEPGVPLFEAASRAYSHTRGTAASEAAERDYDNPLTWYVSYFIAISKTPMSGNLKFSQKREIIDASGYDPVIDGNEIILKEINGRKSWHNIRIADADLHHALAQLSKTAGQS